MNTLNFLSLAQKFSAGEFGNRPIYHHTVTDDDQYGFMCQYYNTAIEHLGECFHEHQLDFVLLMAAINGEI